MKSMILLSVGALYALAACSPNHLDVGANAANASPAQPDPGTGWPMVGQSPLRQARTAAVGPRHASPPAWQRDLDAPPVAPVIGPDGTIYVGTWTSITAIAQDGSTRWSVKYEDVLGTGFDATGELSGIGAIGADGTLYTGGRSLCAIEPANGHSKWCQGLDGSGNETLPVVVPSHVYVGCDHALYAFRPDGTSEWTIKIDGAINPAAIAPDGTLYFAGTHDANSQLVAVTPQGAKKWTHALNGVPTIFGPAVAGDGTVYVTVDDATLNAPSLYAFGPDGATKWTAGGAHHAVAAPAVGADGTIYVPTREGSLYAVDAAGKNAWELALPAPPMKNVLPVIGGDGSVYVASRGALHAVGPAGTLAWSMQLDGSIFAPPAFVANGTLLFGINDANATPQVNRLVALAP